MIRTALIALSLAVVVAACGDSADAPGTTTGSTTSTTQPPQGEGIMLMIEDIGGFAPVEFVVNRPPTFVLLYDGTLIFQGPQDAVFPGPVLPNMVTVNLSDDQMQDVRVLIEASGLDSVDDKVNNDAANFVADATSTVATYTDPGGGTHRFEVYALGITEDPADDIANLALLRDKLQEFTGSGTGEPYVADRLVVRVLEGGFSEDGDTRPWAFEFEPDSEPISMAEVPCRVLEGEAAAAARATLADATVATNWEHANGTFLVLGRDLLPGETGCDQ